MTMLILCYLDPHTRNNENKGIMRLCLSETYAFTIGKLYKEIKHPIRSHFFVGNGEIICNNPRD